MDRKINMKRILESYLDASSTELDVRDFMYIEMILGILNAAGIKPKNGWILLTQYYKSLLGDEFVLEWGRKLYALRKKGHRFGNQSSWINALDNYKEIDIQYRMFEIDETNCKLNKISYNTLPDREEIYEELFEILLEDDELSMNFPKQSRVTYYRDLRKYVNLTESTKNKLDVTLDLPAQLIRRDNRKLEYYRNKLELSIPENYNWGNLLKEMKKGWEDRPVISIVSEKSEKEEEIKYNGQIHIIGDVGKGKSTYKIAETYRLVNEHGAKVGIIEGKIEDVIKTVKNLRELGIKAVPIIGKTNMNKHYRNYIRNCGKNVKCIGEFAGDDFKEVGYLSGICTLAALTNDSEITPSEFPCRSLYEDEERRDCPLYLNCGYFNKFVDLLDADVWVTTPHSLINTTVPRVIDPYERTFYEAFHDLLDIIIVDEADSVQCTLDNIFLLNENLYGGEQSLVDKFQELSTYIEKNNLINGDSLIYNWHMNFKQLGPLIPKINRMIEKTKELHNYLRGEVLTSFKLLSDIKESLRIDEYKENEKLIKKLEGYMEYSNTYDISYDSIKHEFNDLYYEFIRLQNIGLIEDEIRKRIISIFEEYSVTIPKNKGGTLNVELLYSKFELFIYIVQLDFNIKILSRDYPILTEKLWNSYERVNVYEGRRKALRKFLMEPITGVIFGYKFNVNGKFYEQGIDIFRYDGVGRRLLDHMHEIKKEIGVKGPAIVLLSGTSFAPGSGHYDLRTAPEYILKSGDDNSRIEQKLLRKYDGENVIKVSGLRGEMRNASLRKLAGELIRDIRIELAYWKANGENRKVLLVVNSYDNCKEVGQVLKSTNISFRILSREIVDSNYDFTRELLENFADETDGADILVVPLNVISRGYNILDTNGKSYFGSIFFLVRPYMVPEDLESYFQILHSNIDYFIEKSISKSKDIGEMMANIRKKSYGKLAQLSQNRFWKTLDSEFRMILSWFTLIPIKQAIGRLQRGGTSCRVFYCDGSFAPELMDNEEITAKNSMLKAWYDILNEHKDSIFIKELYGKFLNGLEDMIEELNAIQYEEEWNE